VHGGVRIHTEATHLELLESNRALDIQTIRLEDEWLQEKYVTQLTC
jgi:hypothetical protein